MPQKSRRKQPEEEEGELDEFELTTLPQLKKELRELNLSDKGTRLELIQRIKDSRVDPLKNIEDLNSTSNAAGTPYVCTIRRVVCRELANVESMSLSWSGLSAGKNDPFVKFTFGKWEAETEPIDDGGDKAEWNHLNKVQFGFKVTDTSLRQHKLKIEVYDANQFKSHTIIGAKSIPIDSLIDMINLPTDFTVDIENKKAEITGKVTVHMRMVVDKMAIEAADRKRELAKTMELTDTEKSQKRIAIIDILAADFSQKAMKVVISSTIEKLKAKVITRHDYMLAHKRDIHITKVKPPSEEIDYDDLEGYGTNKYALVGVDPPSLPYLRDFKHESFKESLKLVHNKLSNFQDLVSIDLSGQKIGFEGMEKLCNQMQRAPIKILSLTDNDLKDDSLELLSTILRSLGQLEQLHLNQNRFTDTGLIALLGENTYSSTIRLLNIATNGVGTRSAYYLGMMFSPKHRKEVALNQLILGGCSVRSKSFGDDFLRILFHFISKPDSRPIIGISYADGGIDVPGILSMAAMIASSPTLQSVNISRNPLAVTEKCKKTLVSALYISPSVSTLQIGLCGLTNADKKIFNESLCTFVDPVDGRKRRKKMTWHENTIILGAIAHEMWESKAIERRMAKILFNDWKTQFNPASSNPTVVNYYRMDDPEKGVIVVFLKMLCDIGLDEETAEIACTLVNTKAPPRDVPEPIRDALRSLMELIKWYQHIKKSLNTILSSSGYTQPDHVNIRTESCVTCLRLVFVQIAEFRAAAKRLKRRRATAAAQAALMTNALLMLIDDCHAHFMELGTSIELAIGEINKKVIEAANGSDPDRNQVPIFNNVGPILEAYYTHYYYYGQPVDKNRADVQAAIQEKKDRLARLEAKKLIDKESKKGKKSKRSRKAQSPTASRPTTAAEGDNDGEDVESKKPTLGSQKDTDDECNRKATKESSNDTNSKNENLMAPAVTVVGERRNVAPDITKFIYRPRMIDILKKRDDPAEMPHKATGRETRRHFVITRPFALDKEVPLGHGQFQPGVFLSGFVEFDRSVKLPPFARFNSYRHIVRMEQKMVNQLIERVIIREDESK